MLTILRTLLTSGFLRRSRRNPTPGAPDAPRFALRPRVEGVEDRTLPSTFLAHGLDATALVAGRGDGGSADRGAFAAGASTGVVRSGDLAVQGARRPSRAASRVVAMAVSDLSGGGSDAAIYVDQGLDRVVVNYGDGRSEVVADRSTGLLRPTAAALADLNGDGLPDLIVADSGRDEVLIFPGLSDGQFGPAIDYLVGANPAGITVADLTGSLPDLVIADEGSSQVSILINQSQKGDSIAFSPGLVLNAGGSGPVSTVVGHFTGSPYPELLVTNSGSGTVTLLPGVGPGVFDAQSARVYAVGSNPVATIVGNFDGQVDLVTINAGSNSLTIISGFAGPDPTVTTISSGGLDPTTAFAFDAGNGYQGLVVGNSSDGELALFVGGPKGLTMVSVDSDRRVPAPTALAFSAIKDGTVEFYAATAGKTSAVLVSMSLSTSQGSGSGLGSPPSSAPSVRLVAANDTSLPLVATVLTLTVTVPGDELDPSGGGPTSAATTATVAVSGTSVGQGPSSPSRSRGTSSDGSGDLAETAADAKEAPSALAPWERYALGVDEAIEKLGREGASVLTDPSGPIDRAVSPSAPGLPASPVGRGPRPVPDRQSVAGWNDPDRIAAVDGGPADEGVGIGGEVADMGVSTREDLGLGPASSGPGEADPSNRASPRHGHRLAPAGLALTLLAARWGTLRLGGRPGAPGRPGRPAVRRSPHGLTC